MSTVVFWAVVGAVLALRLTPLWGIVVGVLAAIAGMAVNVGMIAASASVLAGSVNAGHPGGLYIIARDACVVVFIACAALIVLLAHLIRGGSVGPSRG